MATRHITVRFAPQLGHSTALWLRPKAVIGSTVWVAFGATTGDGITYSQTEGVKRLVPFQSHLGKQHVLNLLTVALELIAALPKEVYAIADRVVAVLTDRGLIAD